MLVLHNLCIDLDDKPEKIPFFPAFRTQPEENIDVDLDVELPDRGGQAEDIFPDIPAGETDEWLRGEGFRRREEILDQLFPLE